MKKLILMIISALSLVAANYPYKEVVSYNVGIEERLNSAGIVNELVSALADQLSQNKDFLNNKTPIGIFGVPEMLGAETLGAINGSSPNKTPTVSLTAIPESS